MSAEIVIIADDEKDVGEVVAEALRKSGYETVTVENGKQVLGVLEQRQSEFGEARVAAIVSDWMMPELSGTDLLQHLRSGPFKMIPFILMSGAVTRDHLLGALRLGADSILLKPFTSEAMLRKVQEAIESRMQKELQNL